MSMRSSNYNYEIYLTISWQPWPERKSTSETTSYTGSSLPSKLEGGSALGYTLVYFSNDHE